MTSMPGSWSTRAFSARDEERPDAGAALASCEDERKVARANVIDDRDDRAKSYLGRISTPARSLSAMSTRRSRAKAAATAPSPPVCDLGRVAGGVPQRLRRRPPMAPSYRRGESPKSETFSQPIVNSVR